MAQTLYPFFDIYRAAFRTAGDAVRSSLEGAARLRNHQLAVIKDALDSHAQLAATVGDANGTDQFVTLPANLASMQLRMVMGYWSSFFQLAAEHQIESAGRIRAQAEQHRENFRNMLAAGSDGHASMVATLQPLINAASLACDLGRHAIVAANMACEESETITKKTA